MWQANVVAVGQQLRVRPAHDRVKIGGACQYRGVAGFNIAQAPAIQNTQHNGFWGGHGTTPADWFGAVLSYDAVGFKRGDTARTIKLTRRGKAVRPTSRAQAYAARPFCQMTEQHQCGRAVQGQCHRRHQ